MGHSRQVKIGAGGRYGAFGLVDRSFGFCTGRFGSAQVRLQVAAVQYDERLAESHVVAGFTETWTVLRDPEGNGFCVNHAPRDA